MPTSPWELFARAADRLFDHLRDAEAFSLDESEAVDGDLESLRGRQYAVLVTFRRTGEAVPSPVWIGLDERGRVYVKTRHDAGKVKRLRRDPRALLAASNVRGKPVGSLLRATGRVLPHDEWLHAEATLAGAYGAGRKFTERLAAGPEGAAAYLELTARH